MSYLLTFLEKVNGKITKNYLVEFFNFFINILIFITIGFLFYFAFSKVYTFFGNTSSEHFLHDMVFMLVLVKVYRLLLSFLQHHCISVKYMMEISIIAPAIEIVFAFDKHSATTLLILGAFGLVNLLIYIIYYEKLLKIDKN